ncbi:MAG: patatin-like phospholipase family protein [Ignavibacteriales bacterium]|nr:patatin-like phospholipase family protein [Ignavibacteriales bacterium]
MSKSNVALVLGSGGARGLAHIGVLKALHENEVPVHLVTGTSMGALIGGLYASGVDVAAMEKIVHEVDKLMVARIFIPKLFSPGFIDNKRIISFIKELAGDINIEDMPVPFSAVATDFITGEEVIFNKGPLVEAIMASIAIPTVLQPVFIKGRCLIDGGLNNPLPVSVAKCMGKSRIKKQRS